MRMSRFPNLNRFVSVLLLSWQAASAQQLGAAACLNLAGGCDAGKRHDAALQKAIGRFDGGLLYGGTSDTIIFSSALDGSALAQVAYSCNSGAVPPAVNGSLIRAG